MLYWKFISLLQAISSAMLLWMGGFVYLSSKKNAQKRVFLVYCLITSLWVLMGAWRDWLRGSPPLLSIPLSLFLGSFIGATAIHFFLLFPRPISNRVYILVPLYGVSLMFSILSLTYTNPMFKLEPVMSLINLPNFLPLYLLYNLLAVSSILFLVFYQIKTHCGIEKNQLICLGLGVTIPLILVIIFNLVLIFFNNISLTFIGRLSFVIFSSAVFYSIVNHDSFNIKTAIHYTFFWIGMTLLAGLPIFGLYYTFGPEIHLLYQDSPLIHAIILCLITVASAFFLYWIQPKLNQRFFKRKHELDKAWINLLNKLQHMYSDSRYIQTIDESFFNILYTKKTSLYVFQFQDDPVLANSNSLLSQSDVLTSSELNRLWSLNRSYIQLEDVVVGFVLSHKTHILGILFLSEKKNLTPYTKDELKFIKRVRDHISLNLHAKLLQHDLVQSEAQKLQEKALAKGIIHDVKNTHHSISGLLNLVLNKKIDNEKEALMVIAEQSSRLHTYSINYLYTEIIQSPSFKPTLVPTNVLKIIHESINANAFVLAINGLTITPKIPDKSEILADSILFQLVIGNIINNYAKYLPGNSNVTISLISREAEIELSFTPIITVDSPSHVHHKSNIESTGFGHSLIQNIMSWHDGSFRVENDQHGYRYYLTLKGNYHV